ncbi:MAG TPA: hypothetical protein PK598_09090 [Thermoanaerobaculia bacterium]|nr:hypothetical protein [Thermoanaerobaculia bacterium]
MFRTSRAFLLVAPAAFLVTLVSFLVSHPRAPDAFAAYPFMAEALGPGVVRHPVLRFVLTSLAFFAVPYAVLGLLLVLSELGLGAALPLWKRRKGPGRADRGAPAESRWAFLGVSGAVAAWAGISLHRVAHGGELPGGVNVAPLFVVAAAFGAVAAGLVASLLVAVPRALFGRSPGPRVRRAA